MRLRPRRQCGSPPPTWGQYRLACVQRSHHRFTPTNVGTIGTTTSTKPRWTVHPHARGDNGPTPERAKTINGSPPRPWGQSRVALEALYRVRFTPTLVGTMNYPAQHVSMTSVHPHQRGDNEADKTADLYHCGSPPRSWGQSPQSVIRSGHFRFTPTLVGTIVLCSGRRFVFSVHPHARGDNYTRQSSHRKAHGSPPRSWGQ